MTTLIKLEILRVLRNRRYLVFTLILPAVLYTVMIGAYGTVDSLAGVSVKAYFMVSMATLGTVSASMTTNATRIALERKSGWARQLRLTALPGYGYVVAKIASTAAATLPSILVVFAVGYAEGVRLAASEWLLLGLTLWLGGFVFAALGVALGYSAAPDSIQPIIMIVYMLLLMLGGTYFQITGSFGDVAKWTPVALYNQLGRVAQTGASVGTGTIAAVLAYALAFGALAAFLYQRDRRES
ncbi:ABC transporter permease [Streptacidiphilus sp. PB12-B1b]|uniref:ABC transporter permease n=1 Tax=Streptacidiphilus sp. PB12-B1b TaxID=2705012 RepID=UPI0015FE2DAD|nr:ABC transporter permease [Streptacidiphilus sp. PB12-B1b]QMU75181.1 ABC transporter permease [Streptacidiphilus sp. PB12-B1b]